ncbi:unnamed protein product, partial [Pylaiella littoralis]
ELATAAGCPHGPELVTFSQNKRAARTCGQHQAHVLAALSMQDVLARQDKLDGNIGYCKAKRVRNQ